MENETQNPLIEIQAQLKAPKSQRNNFGKYNYRSCEDILTAVKPILSKLGCYINLSDDVVLIGERFYLKATATLFDKDGKSIASSVGLARESSSKKGMDEAQITGAASSYARKYALNGLLAIDDTKDVDSYDNSSHNNSQKKFEPIPMAKKEDFEKWLNELQPEISEKIKNQVTKSYDCQWYELDIHTFKRFKEWAYDQARQ